MNKPKVLLIYTGGTIGMIEDTESGSLRPFDFNHLFNQVPELKRFNIDIDCISFEKPIDSSNMSPKDWIKMAEIIEQQYTKYDGFVILHGSDTMAFSASALSFMLENLAKPVIFTGSQLPIGKIRTDGKENLITAIEIAAAKENGQPIVPEVAIYFEYCLYRGNRTHKFNAEHFQAFRSANYPHLAEAGVHIKYNYSAILKPSNKKLIVHKKLDNRIAILKIFPGIRIEVIKSIVNIPDLKALIIETFGAGNAPIIPEMYEVFENAIKGGMIILNVTQCNSGSVDQGRYETSTYFNKIGVIGGKDITTEAAVAKLMFLLASDKSLNEIKKLLSVSLRGEITE
jgi:L-asparaginase